MDSFVPPALGEKLSRRAFVRRSLGACAGFGIAAGLSRTLAASAGAAPVYQGDLVLASQVGASPDKALPKILERFQAANPGITPKTLFFPEEKFVAMYTAAQTAGQQIDLLMLNGQDLRRYATSGGLITLDDLPFKSRFIPEALPPFTVNGHLWGVPSGALGGFPIYVNAALLQKYNLGLPKTYDELKNVSRELASHGVQTFTHPGKVIYMWPVWFFTTFAQTSGNRSIDRTKEILAGKGKFTDEDVVAGIDLVFQFARDKMFSPGLFSLDFPNALNEFTTGKAAFYLFHDSVARSMLEASGPALQVEMMLMPNLTGKTVRSQFPGGPGTVVSIPAKVDPKRRDAAYSLLDFLSMDESDSESVALNGGAVPVNAHVRPPEIPVYQKEKEVISDLVTYLDWFWAPEITRGFQEGLQAGVAGRVKAEELAKTLQSTLDRLAADGYVFKG